MPLSSCISFVTVQFQLISSAQCAGLRKARQTHHALNLIVHCLKIHVSEVDLDKRHKIQQICDPLICRICVAFAQQFPIMARTDNRLFKFLLFSGKKNFALSQFRVQAALMTGAYYKKS